ncbi:MAG: hypothetical protein GX386_10060 [Clostridiaceae bacterium]|jgi:hypothetical protein|nr:hypothetical protein [Clostridiaceae bacterium]
MAKKGMRRPDPEEPHGTESNKKQHFDKNEVYPVPELQGKAKHTKEKANPIRYDGKKNTTWSQQ